MNRPATQPWENGTPPAWLPHEAARADPQEEDGREWEGALVDVDKPRAVTHQHPLFVGGAATGTFWLNGSYGASRSPLG